MPETPDTREDHRVVVLVDFVGFAHWEHAAESRLHEPIVDRHEERRGRHRQRNRGDEQVGHVCVQHAVLRRECAEDESEFATLRESESEEVSLRRLQPRNTTHGEQDDEFHREHAEHQQRHRPGLSGDQARS